MAAYERIEDFCLASPGWSSNSKRWFMTDEDFDFPLRVDNLDFAFCQPAPPIMVPPTQANKPACFVKPTTDESTRFAKPTTDEDVKKAKLAAVPECTRKDT